MKIDIKQLETDLKRSAKRTVGYSEADDKKSYEVGMQYALGYLLEKLQNVSRENDYLEDELNVVNKDLKILAEIISRYAP